MSGTEGNPQTPFQEALSIITIAAIFVGIGSYAAAIYNVPLIAPTLYWIAVQIYHAFPALNNLHPIVVSAAAVGIVFFFLTIPLATGWLGFSAELGSTTWSVKLPC